MSRGARTCQKGRFGGQCEAVRGNWGQFAEGIVRQAGGEREWRSDSEQTDCGRGVGGIEWSVEGREGGSASADILTEERRRRREVNPGPTLELLRKGEDVAFAVHREGGHEGPHLAPGSEDPDRHLEPRVAPVPVESLPFWRAGDPHLAYRGGQRGGGEDKGERKGNW